MTSPYFWVCASEALNNASKAKESNNSKGINADIAFETFIFEGECADFVQMKTNQPLFDNKPNKSTTYTGTSEECGSGLTTCLRSSSFRPDLVSTQQISNQNESTILKLKQLLILSNKIKEWFIKSYSYNLSKDPGQDRKFGSKLMIYPSSSLFGQDFISAWKTKRHYS